MTQSARPGRPRTIWRLAAAAAFGILVAVLPIALHGWRYAPGVAWAVTATVFCGRTWMSIWPLSAEQARAHATAEDPSRSMSDILLLTAAVVSLAALGLVIAAGESASGTVKLLLALLDLSIVAVSWVTVHTVFTLRYALLYYSAPVGGISFNQDEPPDYRDFAYVAMTLGMTYQVSDTNVRSSAIRAAILRHALLSYVFGAVILAVTINLIAGLGSSG